MKAEQKDEYLYGMNMFFNVCVNIISMILIGALTGRLWECIVFCLVYKIIRKYTGGFHFESAVCCYISSCIMYFIIIGAIVYIPFRIYEVTVLTVISSAIIWIISPIEAVNKPLDECEQSVFKKRARINIIAMFILYTICLLAVKEAAQVVAVSIICVTLFAVAGKIKLILCKEKK